jgi:hypothetical protein
MFLHFTSGFVNKIEGPHTTASGNEITIEGVEIGHEGLTIKLAN